MQKTKKKTLKTTDIRIVTLVKSQVHTFKRDFSRNCQEAHLAGCIARTVPLLRQKKLKARLTFSSSHSNWSEAVKKKMTKHFVEQ